MDRDFLLGVIAVQLGQATPQQVMAAAAAFFSDKSKSIPDRLLAEGVFTPERLKMLRDMVDDAVKAHGGDVPKTAETFGGQQAVFASFGGAVAVDDKGSLSLVPKQEAGSASLDGSSTVVAESPGRYRMEADAEIGRGGIGRVLVAFDESVGREIAVKELLPEASSQTSSEGVSRTAAACARFLREARVTGQLEHPNIVPVYEIGKRANGTFYYTMKLVRGRTLSKALRGCTTLAERLKLLHHYVDLCNAVAYAHHRNIVHRDLKPENVMLGEFGETVVLDWGLAKVKGGKDDRAKEMARDLKLLQGLGTGQTVDGSAIGTPAYMPPEQADGAIAEIDERSDVWSLGAVLYEILTGVPPFEGSTPFEIIGKVLKDPVRSPLELDEKIPPELAAVALKALSRERERRYQKAGDLSAEIGAFMTGGRIGAYQYSSWELLRGFVAKNRAASALVVILFVFVLAGSGLLWQAYQKAGQERDRAEEQRTVAEAEKQRANEREFEAHLNLSRALVEKAERLLRAKQPLAARVFAAASLVHNPCSSKGPHRDPGTCLRSSDAEEMLTLGSSVFFQSVHTSWMKPDQVLRTDSDLKRLVSSQDGALLAASSVEEKVFVWEASSGRRLFQVEKVVGAELSPDGRELATVTTAGTLEIRDARAGTLLRTLPAPGASIEGAWYDLAGKVLTTLDASAALKRWDAGSFAPLGTRPITALPGGGLFRSALAVSGANALGLIYSGGQTELLDRSSGATLGRVDLGKRADGLALSPDKATLAGGLVDWSGSLADVATGRVVRKLVGHREGIHSVAYSPDGSVLATGSGDRTVGLWNTETGALVSLLEGHTAPVRTVLFSDAGRTLWSASSDGTVRRFRRDEDVASRRLPGHRARIWRVAVSPDGARAASASGDGTVRLWDLRRRALERAIPMQVTEVMTVAFSPDGSLLASAGTDGKVQLRRAADGAPLAVLDGHSKSVSGVVFSPDGRLLASAGTDRKLLLWDVASRAVVGRMERHDLHGEAAFSPDGKLIASADKGKRVRIWSVEDQRQVAVLEGHPDDAFNVAFSRDGKKLATTGMNGHVVIWSVETLQKERELVGHDRWVNTAEYSPDGELIVTGSDEQTVRVWSARTGKTLLVLQVDQEGYCARFLPDGRSLILVDGLDVRLYPLDLSVRDADPVQLLAEAERASRLRLDGFSVVPAKEQPPPAAGPRDGP